MIVVQKFLARQNFTLNLGHKGSKIMKLKMHAFIFVDYVFFLSMVGVDKLTSVYLNVLIQHRKSH